MTFLDNDGVKRRKVDGRPVPVPKIRESIIPFAKRRVVKLIRSFRAVANPEYKGAPYESNTVTHPHLLNAMLVLKMHEEVGEIQKALNDPEEYADLLQAMMDTAALNGVSWSQIEAIREEKKNDSGGFIDGVYLYRGM